MIPSAADWFFMDSFPVFGKDTAGYVGLSSLRWLKRA